MRCFWNAQVLVTKKIAILQLLTTEKEKYLNCHIFILKGGKRMNLEERITNAVMDKLTDGTVEKLVKQNIESAINRSLDDLFSWSGAGKKMIDEKVKEVIVPVIERHDFNKYIVKLDSVLTEIINQTSLAENKEILENFKSLMVEPNVKVIKLSEIFEKYCEYVARDVETTNLEACCEDGEPYYEPVTANMEVEHEDKWISSSEYCRVKFSCDEDNELNKELRLYRSKDDKNWNISWEISTFCNINSLRNLSDFDTFLITLKRGWVDVELDTESEYADDIEPQARPEWTLD